MADEQEKVIVEIYGEKHVVRGKESPDYILKVAHEVDKKMRLIAQRLPRLAVHQIAILAALNLADELEKLREEQETLLQLIESPEE
ncbi:cell division protein ZapA [Desulfitobacterium sp. THU1]|uniref:cell division protein ZapA n=1 Tax=Desulfitobacterium sp. THU1 TaxID=3138072 RepID=UPI00311D7E2A